MYEKFFNGKYWFKKSNNNLKINFLKFLTNFIAAQDLIMFISIFKIEYALKYNVVAIITRRIKY